MTACGHLWRESTWGANRICVRPAGHSGDCSEDRGEAGDREPRVVGPDTRPSLSTSVES